MSLGPCESLASNLPVRLSGRIGACMSSLPTIVELFDTKVIVDDDVVAVARAYVANPSRSVRAIGEGYLVDVAAAVAAHSFATAVMRVPWTDDDLRRVAVRTAVLLTRPTRA